MSKYVGWIPTLIGNISYTLAGRSNYPSIANVCIFETAGTFHYIISQRRVCHDSQMGFSSLIPSKRLAKEYEALILKRKGIYSVWEAVLIGSCQQQFENTPEGESRIVGKNFQNLQGNIIFIPKIQKTKKIIGILNESINGINSYLWNNESNFSQEKAFQIKEALSTSLNDVRLSIDKEFSFLRCSFTLQRNGICFLSNLEKIEKIEKNTNCTDATSEEQIDDQEYLTDSQAYNQIFYFIKDIFHTHKFHSPDYDTLTQAYEFNGNDSIGWAKETLKDFYRTAIRIEPEESLGIIYYSRAFKNIIETDKTLTPEDDKSKFNDGFSFFDINSISDKSAEDVCKTRVDGKKRILDTKKWQVGLIFTALLLIWNKANEEIFSLLGMDNKLLKLTVNFIIPVSIAWFSLVYVEKVSLSKSPQMIKFTKYLSSISNFFQIATLLGVFIVGICLCIISLYWKTN